MWILSVLVFTYRVIIYRYIYDPFRGRSQIDVINGYEKTYLRQKMCMIGTEESNNKSMRMNAALMICDKIKGLKFFFFLKIASSCVNFK